MIKKLFASNSTQKTTYLFLATYTVAYLYTRLTSLTVLPAHYDELLQLLRIDLMVIEGDILGGLFGDELYLLKMLQLLLITPLLWLPASSLWIGRFVSVLAGLMGGIGCYVLGVELYRRSSIGIVAALLYFVSPFVLLYDRLIMPDGILSAIGVWTMIFSVWMVRRGQLRWAFATGIAIVAAALTKLPGFIYLVIPLTALILLEPARLFTKLIRKQLLIVFGLALAVFVGTLVVFWFNPEILQVYVNKTSSSQLISWQLWLNNSQTAISWVSNLMTVPLLLLGILGGLVALVRRDKPGIFLLTIPLVLPAAFILVSKAWFPRYLLPVVPSLAILGAWLLLIFYDKLGQYNRLTSWRLPILICLGVLLITRAIVTDFWLFTDPSQAPLHARERWQYIEDWPTTYRLDDAADFIENIAPEYDKIYLAVNENTLVVSKGLEYYFDQPDNTEIVTFDAHTGHTIDLLNKWALDRPTFLILNLAKERGMDRIWQSSELFFQGIEQARYYKPGNKASINVYRWMSVPEAVNQWAKRSAVEPAIVLSPQYTPAAENKPPNEEQLREANFVLVDMSTGLFNSPEHLRDINAWIKMVPRDWVLTRYYPGQWYLFRLANNALPQYSTQSTLDASVSLVGFDLPQKDFMAGNTVPLTVHWKLTDAVSEDYTVFIYLLAEDGTKFAYQEYKPLIPTSKWYNGQQLADGYDIVLDRDMPSGTYKLVSGMINPSTQTRLPAVDAAGNRWPGDAIALDEIVVEHPTPSETNKTHE